MSHELYFIMHETFNPIAQKYDPLLIGSIDATDTVPHDNAIRRAIGARYKPNVRVTGDPEYTLFIGRLSPQTDEESLRKEFFQYGEIKKLRLVRDVLTGSSCRYAFVEFWSGKSCEKALKDAHHRVIDGSRIIVDFEHERLLPGWVPRRLGGGFGGRKESGQLRFGCRERPFRMPFKRRSFPETQKTKEHRSDRYYRTPYHHKSYRHGQSSTNTPEKHLRYREDRYRN